MASTGFEPKSEPTWHWPKSVPLPADSGPRHRMPGGFQEDPPSSETTSSPPPPKQEAEPKEGDAPPQAEQRRTYGPRTCRICLEVVYPQYHMPSDSLPGFLQSRTPHVTWESEDPESGRLIRPCKCRGSSRYVHEGCLDQWRKADPAMGNRNYWVCPTCGFQYRLERMSWGRWINNTFTQVFLTVTILFLTVFLLGFVADPIINLYLDPYDTIYYGVEKITLDEDGSGSWIEHLFKGLASLGLLGFVKVIFALSPWQWWNLRSSGILNAGTGRQTGRDRLASVSWIVVVMGIGTFVWAVYKGVRVWSRRTLEMASERVMDVPLDGDGNDDDGEPEPQQPGGAAEAHH